MAFKTLKSSLALEEQIARIMHEVIGEFAGTGEGKNIRAAKLDTLILPYVQTWRNGNPGANRLCMEDREIMAFFAAAEISDGSYACSRFYELMRPYVEEGK